MSCEKKTYDVTVPFMYIAGVDRRYFNGGRPRGEERYAALDMNPEARDVRCLCMVRTAVMANSGPVSFGLTRNGKTLSEMPECIPAEAMEWLAGRGIQAETRGGVQEHVAFLDAAVRSRIDQARELFPAWINWDYLKGALLLPDGGKSRAAGAALAAFTSGRGNYPFGTWISWKGKPERMILRDDPEFLRALYGLYGEEPPDPWSEKADRAEAEASLAAFLSGHGKTLVAADCENNDPARLVSALKAIGARASGTVLVDSREGSAAWEMLDACGLVGECGAEHVTAPSLSGYKNQADMALAVAVSRKVYTEGYDSVILASSDCDYWALISSLPETDFLVMADREKCGHAMERAVTGAGQGLCWLNGFADADARKLGILTLRKLLGEAVRTQAGINLYSLLRKAEERTGIVPEPEDEAGLLRGAAAGLGISVNGAWDVAFMLGAGETEEEDYAEE